MLLFRACRRLSASATGFQSASVVVTAERASPAWLRLPTLGARTARRQYHRRRVVIATALPAWRPPCAFSIRCIHGVDGSSASHGLSRLRNHDEARIAPIRHGPDVPITPCAYLLAAAALRPGTARIAPRASAPPTHMPVRHCHRLETKSGISTSPPFAAAARRARSENVNLSAMRATNFAPQPPDHRTELPCGVQTKQPWTTAAIRSPAKTTDTRRTTGGTGLDWLSSTPPANAIHASVTCLKSAAGGAETPACSG